MVSEDVSNSVTPIEILEESKDESVEEIKLDDFEPGEDTVSARCDFMDNMQNKFNNWELKQNAAGKRRTPHHYPKNSLRTQQHHKKAAKVHRPFGQTGSIMAIEHFLLGQLTRLMMTSEFLQYIVNFYVLNS
jgi:hypothetical protein